MCAFVVDDTPGNRMVLDLILGASGQGIRRVADGQSAVAANARCHTELVLMDLQTCGAEGLVAPPVVKPAGEAPTPQPLNALMSMIREIIDESRRRAAQRPPLAS